jgi:hypothetical protein
MITNQALANQSKSGNGQEPINIQRRILMSGALAALLVSPRSVHPPTDRDLSACGCGSGTRIKPWSDQG